MKSLRERVRNVYDVAADFRTGVQNDREIGGCKWTAHIVSASSVLL
jgi:hypothetical protein